MNEQKFVRIIGTTKDYIVFPDELGNFPETVQIAEPTKQTFENILEKTIDPKQPSDIKLRTYKRVKFVENRKIKIDYIENCSY